MKEGNSYRILSLDGGGSWAIIQIRALQALFGKDAYGHEVLKHFKLVVANSGGSIAAMAMAENWTLSKIISLYLDEKERRRIFVTLNFVERSILRKILKLLTGVGPKYKTAAKLKGLEKVFPLIGKMRLTDLPEMIGENSPHFLIASFDYDRERANFFRSDQDSKAQTHIIATMNGYPTSSSFDSVTVAQALHASSNAPLNYFDKPAKIPLKGSKSTRRYWDGAVAGYNNPLMAGLVEALTNGIALESINILSIGTGNSFLPLKQLKQLENGDSSHKNAVLCQKPDQPSLANDIAKMATSILSDPPDAATYTAYTLLGTKYPHNMVPLVRMNPLIQPLLSKGKWILPPGLTTAEFKRLNKLDLDAVAQKDVELIDHFCRLWLSDKVPNQPVRTNAELQPILGHGWFSQAKAAAAQQLQKVETPKKGSPLV